jgi:DTW domain-containing protein YfiP
MFTLCQISLCTFPSTNVVLVTYNSFHLLIALFLLYYQLGRNERKRGYRTGLIFILWLSNYMRSQWNRRTANSRKVQWLQNPYVQEMYPNVRVGRSQNKSLDIRVSSRNILFLPGIWLLHLSISQCIVAKCLRKE